MLAASPSSPLRDGKGSRSTRGVSGAKRAQSRKEKVNVVSKASLAMLNPAYAMGIDVAPSWCDSPLSSSAGAGEDDAYDSLREWGIAGPAAAGALARSVAKAGDDIGGALDAWRSRPYWAQQQSDYPTADGSWRMSPTPELEAFTLDELDVLTASSASASSSSSDLPMGMGEYASDYSLDAPSASYTRSSFEHDDDDAAAAAQAPVPKGRKGRGARRASEDEQAQYSASGLPIAGSGSKGSSGGKSLSRFFSWKRSTKHLGGGARGAAGGTGAAGIVVPPLPAFDGAYGEYAAMPMSAPPAVTTFEAALAGTGAPRHRFGIEESYPAQRLERGGRPSLAVESTCETTQAGSGSVSAPCTPVRAPQGLPPAGAAPAPQQQQQQQPSVAQRASKFLGRKYSMPTLREVRRAQANAVGGGVGTDSAVVWAESAQVGVLGSMPVEPSTAVPTLPPLFGTAGARSESMSPIIPSTSSSSSGGDGWGGAPRSRISSVGRGTARKGTESIYDGISSPRSPGGSRSPKLSTSGSGIGRRGEFVVDEEHSLAYAGVLPQLLPLKALASEPRMLGQGGGSFAEKAMRRRSRSMGSATAPPPRLSRFGSPPTGFTPTSPYVATFSPVLASVPLAGLGRGRGMPVAQQQRGNGTPTQQSVAAFSAGRGAAMAAAAAAAAAAEEAQPRSSSEGETVQQARRVNLGGGRAGVRAVAVASPTLVARSPRMPQQALTGRSRSPLRPRQAEPTPAKAPLPVIVNVMPPTPVLCDDDGAAFEGDKPALARVPDGYGPQEEEEEESSSSEEEEQVEQPVQRRPRAAASPRSAMAALRRDTVVIDAAAWVPEAFDVPTQQQQQQALPYMLPASFSAGFDDEDGKLLSRDRRPSLASSELSDMDESVASSDGGRESPFALARSLSSHSLASVSSSSSSGGAYGSPLRTNQSMASSMTASSARSQSSSSNTSSSNSGSSLGLRGMQFDSSSSLCSSTTTSTSILDFGMVSAPSAAGAKEALRQPFSYAPAASSSEPLGEDCETPRLSGGAAQIAVFASPVRSAGPLPTQQQQQQPQPQRERYSPERVASPLLELDLSLPLDLDSLSNAVGLASLHSPKRTLRSPKTAGSVSGKKTSPPKPPKSRARVEQQQQQQQQMRSFPSSSSAASFISAAPSTPPSSRESAYGGASFEDAGLGLGLGLDFGAPQPQQQAETAQSSTPALRVVKRTNQPQAQQPQQQQQASKAADHAALWGELGFAM